MMGLRLRMRGMPPLLCCRCPCSLSAVGLTFAYVSLHPALHAFSPALSYASQAKLVELAAHVVGLFGPALSGVLHFEAKYDLDSGVAMPIELNARIGGESGPCQVFLLPHARASTMGVCI